MFAVFGVHLAKARLKAEKAVVSAEAKKQRAAIKAKKKYQELTPEAFAEAVNAEPERIVGQTKPVRISPEYNVPAAAEHFCSIAKNQAFANLQIFIKAPEQTKDKRGRTKVVGRYVHFIQGKDYSLSGVAQ